MESLPNEETANGDKPFHSKRPHRKSRAGCKNCKIRKVKCDEARPSCRSCTLRKTICVYPASRPTAASPKPTSRSLSSWAHHVTSAAAVDNVTNGHHQETPSTAVAISPARSSTGSSIEPLLISEPLFRPSGARDELEMRLLWFYTAATSTSFSVECGLDRTVEHVMRTRIVYHAFEAPFLMQSLFALSSLHLQTIKQKIDPGRALSYRVNSFEGYRRAIQEARPETFPALICNSLFVTALSSHSFRDPDGKDLYMLDWMVVWRGIGLMLDFLGSEKLVESGLHILFYRPPIDLENSAYSIPNQLLHMVSSIPTDDVDYPDTPTYYRALKYLGALYHHLREGINPAMHLRIVTWLTFVGNEFIDLARLRRPRALVILAHYSMFLKIARIMWWLKGVGHRTIRDICRALGPEWADFLKIPMLALDLEEPEQISRLVLDDPDWTSPPWTESQSEELSRDIRELAWIGNIDCKNPTRFGTDSPSPELSL